jgi:hypothetical protein
MAYGSKYMKGNKPMNRKDKKVAKPISKLQQEKLDEHAEHHTKEHMRLMKKAMRQGMTFAKAHQAAMKKHGK